MLIHFKYSNISLTSCQSHMTNNIIVCFLTFIFQSTNCLTFTWPHVASPLPWLKICAFCVLIPPPLLIPPQSAHVSYMSVSQAEGSLWWIQIPWLQLFSQPQIRHPSIQSRGWASQDTIWSNVQLSNTNASFKYAVFTVKLIYSATLWNLIN